MNKAKAIASGVAAFVGATALVLSSQPIDRLGIEYINQLQWANIIMAVLASYGIVWYVPNKEKPSPETEIGPSSEPDEPVVEGKRGAHRADTTALKLP